MQGETGIGHTLIRRAADKSITSSTTLENDTSLVLALGANESWEFEAFLLTTSASQTPDIKLTFTVPSGSTITWIGQQIGDGSAVSYLPITASGTTIAPTIAANLITVVRVRGVVTVGSTAGNLQLQWAQNQSNNNATVMKAGSFLKCGKF